MKPTIAAILAAAALLALLHSFTGSGRSNAQGDRAPSERDRSDSVAGGGMLADVDPAEIDECCTSPSRMFVGGKSCFGCHSFEGVARMVR